MANAKWQNTSYVQPEKAKANKFIIFVGVFRLNSFHWLIA